MADALERLKKTRSSARTSTTKLLNRIEAYFRDGRDDETERTVLLAQLRRKEQDLMNLDAEVEPLVDVASLDTELETVEEYREKITEWMSRLELQAKSSESASTSLQVPALERSGTGVKPTVKLPGLSIIRFNGDSTNWQNFYSQFQSAINENASLSTVDKFTYLKSFLGGAAATAVAGLPLSETNYETALRILEERFGRRDIIISAHMSNLLDITPVRKSNDIEALRKMYDTCEIQIRSLEALGVVSNTYGSLLCPILLKMIPPDIALEFNRHRDGDSEWQITDLLNLLRKEIESRERTRYLTKPLNNEAPLKQGAKGKLEGQFYGNHIPMNQNKLPSAAALNTTVETKCIFCNSEEHTTNDCNQLTRDDRMHVLKKQGRCFICLKRNHTARNCRSKITCPICKRRHHKTLCEEENEHSSCDIAKKEPTVVASISNNDERKSSMYLQTTKALLNATVVRCLLDSGSERTFIREDVSRNLKLPVVGLEPLKATRRRVKLTLQGLGNLPETVDIEALEAPEICSAIIKMSSSEIQRKLENMGLEVADNPAVTTTYPDHLTLIIGADYYWKMVSGRVERLEESLVAVETIFGWSVHGPATITTSGGGSANVLKVVIENDEQLASAELRKFWELDSMGITDKPESETVTQTEVLKEFESTIKYKKGRYEVNFPWKPQMKERLHDNYLEAKRRFDSLIKRFKRDPLLFAQYEDVIREYLSSGIIEPINEHESEIGRDNPVFYLPHRALIKQDRATTKIRVVFDASCHGKERLSLNNCLYAGINLNADLFELLVKFREHKIALTADIEKAFLQIYLAEEDRDVTRFLWFEGSLAEANEMKLKVYRFTRVPFGVTSSPFLLAATLKHHILKYENEFPQTCKLLYESLYVDDLIGGDDTVEDAFTKSCEVKAILQSAGMSMRKWKTNNNELRERWSEQMKEPENIMISLISEEASRMKVLGIIWNSETDTFRFDSSHLLSFLRNCADSKRGVLQVTGRVFDPVGFLSPFTIRVKCLFQELWAEGVSWDSSLPEHLLMKWKTWCNHLKGLNEIVIPRHYFHSLSANDCRNYELHCFSDASKAAYGAVLYLRIETKQEGILTSFVCSKTRVAPLKPLTLPRLELMGALVAAKLGNRVADCLHVNLTCRFWTDSTIVYHWIRGLPDRFKPFVANRVRDIQALTEPSQWSHCPGNDNPADYLTRGQSLHDLANNTMWWYGPAWLSHSEECWPRKPSDESDYKSESDDLELRSKYHDVIQFQCPTNHVTEPLLDLERYNSVVRIVAWINRFLWNSRNSNNKIQGCLTVKEINRAELYLIKDLQKGHYFAEINALKNKQTISSESKLFSLNPFLDSEKILRVGGRIQNSELPLEQKHPIIISENARFTQLLIMAEHERILHGGVAHTLSQIRNRFWIPRGRQLIKKTIRKCLNCKKFTVRPATEITAPLPKERLHETSPFTCTGVDFAGPLYTKGKHSSEKAYIALFTCAVTRALHLELVSNLSTEKFLLALRRFVARRGVCCTIFSDNAKTFKRAEKDLKELWSITQGQDVQEYLVKNGITWKYIVELSPWWGGFWERLVRSVKTCLKKVLGKALLSFEELTTLLSEVEAVLNMRPLTYTYNEASEPVPLTPAHFLIGDNKSPLLTSPVDPHKFIESSSSSELTKRMVYRRTLLKRIWSTWSTQYLLDLRSAHQQHRPRKNSELKEGDVVLIEESKKARSLWNLGLITKVFPGRDGRIRSCELRTTKGTIIRRAIQLLYPLELSTND